MRFRVLALLFGAALLAAGCGGRATGGGGGAASVVPASVPAYIQIDTDTGSGQWKTVDDLASHFPGKQQAVTSLESSFSEQGVDYARDVKPALGSELDVVWLDFENGGSDVVALLQPKDEGAFKRLIEKGNKQDPTSTTVYEKVGDWEAVSDKQSVLDQFKSESEASGDKLADDSAFQQGMKAVSQDSLVKAYVSGRKVMDALTQYGGAQVNGFLAKAGTLDWVVADVRATSDGVRFDTIVRGTPGKLFAGVHTATPFKPSLPARVPGDALLYFTFHGTGSQLTGLGNNPQLASPALRPLTKLLQRVTSLLQGENALYLRPGATAQMPEITLVAEPKAGTDGAATLDRLFSSVLHAHSAATTVGSTPARTLDFGPFSIEYANVAGHLVVTDLPSGIQLFGSASPTLAQSDTFKDALHTSGMPSNTQGFLYVDIRGGLGLAEKLANAGIPGSVKRNLAPLKSAMEYTATRPSEVQVTLFVRID